jgi:flagellar basal body-associated protein FliL
MSKSSKGFHVIELVVVVVVVAAVALTGYIVWNGNREKKDDTTTSQQTTASEIKDEKDLDTTSITVDELDAAEGESDLNSLEQELNAL